VGFRVNGTEKELTSDSTSEPLFEPAVKQAPTAPTIVRVAAPRHRVSFISFMESDVFTNIAEAVHVTARTVQCWGPSALATYCETGAAGERPDVRRPYG
jgi:hypothetical protein